MTRIWTIRSVVIANIVILFFAVNPWINNWSDQAIAVLIIEVGAIVVIGLPVILFQVLVRKKTFKQSFRDSIDTVMDFLAGIA